MLIVLRWQSQDRLLSGNVLRDSSLGNDLQHVRGREECCYCSRKVQADLHGGSRLWCRQLIRLEKHASPITSRKESRQTRRYRIDDLQVGRAAVRATCSQSFP